MRRCFLAFVLSSLAVAAPPSFLAERTVDHGIDVIRLKDSANSVEVLIAPSAGNRAYALTVHGKNLLYFPSPDIAAFEKSPRPGLNGIPFLAPWANRLSDAGFWANNHRYVFNDALGSVRVDKNRIAIHGMLTNSNLWEVAEVKADRNAAWVTSHLAFWKHPELMANWPFAHEYEMTYRLTAGGLEVRTTIRNLSSETMPVAVGFHPYFTIPDAARPSMSVHIAARQHVETDNHLVATGALTPANLPEQVSLADHAFDDGFTDLVHDPTGHAVFSVRSGDRAIEVSYGPRYTVAVVFSPPGQKFICFEPMTAITNGLNLAHEGKYAALQTVASGASWQESFSVRYRGF